MTQMTSSPTAHSASPGAGRALKLASILCFALALVGYLGVIWLPAVDRRDFFDENALLAGSAAPTIRRAGYAPLDHVLRLVQQEPVSFQLPSWVPGLMDSLGTPVDWTFQAFTQDMGGSPVKCNNFHAVLRAPTTDGTDSILLVTPVGYGSSWPGAFNQTQEAANVAVGLGAAMITHLSTVRWLARDIIWLVPDGECGLLNSVQAWVDTYRLQAAGWDGSEFHRAGLIRQAIVLEVVDHRFAAAELSVEGFDGRLPNLDLYWTLTYFAFHHLAPIPIKLRANPALHRWLARQNLQWETRQHLEKSLNLLEFIWRQAKGTPTGGHAPLLGAGVDAVTLRLIPDGVQTPKPVTPDQLRYRMAQILDVTELTIRSCNNLLESLHHSYKLYLQSGRDHFVSIDMYIIPFTALFLVLIIQLILLHVKLSRSPHPPNPSSWLRGMGRVGMTHVACAVIGLLSRSLPSLSQHATHSTPPNADSALTVRHLMGLSQKLLRTFLTQSHGEKESGLLEDGMGPSIGDEQYLARVAGVIMLVGAGMLVELLWAVGRRAGVGSQGTHGDSAASKPLDWRVLKVLLICSTAMGCGAVACINCSLALLVSGLLLPMVLGTLPIRTSKSAETPSFQPVRIVRMLLVATLSSPLPVVLLASMMRTKKIPESGAEIVDLIKDGVAHWEWSLLTCMVAWGLYAPVWGLSLWLSLTSVEKVS